MNFMVITLALLLGSAGESAIPQPSAPAIAQEAQAVAQQEAPSIDAMIAKFTKYQIAIVRKGPKWTKDAPAKIEKLAAKRGDYWKSMIEKEKLLGVAKLVKPSEFWGLLFFKVDSKDEMHAIAKSAPAVKEGLLAADIRTVWGTRGLGAGLTKEGGNAQPEAQGETYYIVVTAKGPKWSDKADSPETRAANGESMKYLYGLYKQGALRFFAALEDFSYKARTISIMKVSSADEAMKLANENPAVKSGAHVVSVHEVKIPLGIVP
jgi:hypothetical protein